MLNATPHAIATERAQQLYECNIPLNFDGSWLQPEHGRYLLVMIDDYLTTNGYEFVRLEDQSI
jgi:hypothetical protein